MKRPEAYRIRSLEQITLEQRGMAEIARSQEAHKGDLAMRRQQDLPDVELAEAQTADARAPQSAAKPPPPRLRWYPDVHDTTGSMADERTRKIDGNQRDGESTTQAHLASGRQTVQRTCVSLQDIGHE